MKKLIILLLLSCFCIGSKAQKPDTINKKAFLKFSSKTSDEQEPAYYRFTDNYRIDIYLQDYDYDKLMITDIQGKVVLKKNLSIVYSTIDISQLEDGVYLMIISSSGFLKEKSTKFVVRK